MSHQREAASLVIHNRAGQPEVLASDTERDAVAVMLSSAFAEGRLTAAEHAERVRVAYGARTMGELGALTADLPGPAGDVGRRQAVLVPDEVDRSLPCALLICCPPVGIARLLAARRHARAGGGAGAEDR